MHPNLWVNTRLMGSTIYASCYCQRKLSVMGLFSSAHRLTGRPIFHEMGEGRETGEAPNFSLFIRCSAIGTDRCSSGCRILCDKTDVTLLSLVRFVLVHKSGQARRHSLWTGDTVVETFKRECIGIGALSCPKANIALCAYLKQMPCLATGLRLLFWLLLLALSRCAPCLVVNAPFSYSPEDSQRLIPPPTSPASVVA